MKQIDIDIVVEVLKAMGAPIAVMDVYHKAQELYQQGKINNMFQWGGKTPHSTCESRIYTALIETPDKLPFIKVQDKPVLIALKDSSLPPSKPTAKKQPPKERDLHPLLTYIAYHQWGIYTKTIYHEKSTKNEKGLDKWIYPDMVGVSFAYKDFESPHVRDFIKKFAFSINLVKLVSFELKRELKVGNCRQAYFQAISNSSWAHAGYLVAGTLDRDNQELMGLLKQLNQSFGIGVITLDIQSPTQNAILLNAKEKENLDYPTLDKLAERNNSDFATFLESVIDYDSFGSKNLELYKQKFDPIPKNFSTIC
ncbi:hypothetical protein ACFOPX_04330 [Helicobacter baculiformis]|uniref:HrgA protein n=1 Tax=Helicobacter baculiformis TaxID=427351 RepID=A0ABV7ZHV8_9HELI|nr:hypothetical protein [Helicobacter baculiformis]